MSEQITIQPAKYRKGHSVIRCPSDGSGWKTRAMGFVERAGGKWVHRSHGYVLPSKKAARVFLELTQWLARFEATPTATIQEMREAFPVSIYIPKP